MRDPGVATRPPPDPEHRDALTCLQVAVGLEIRVVRGYYAQAGK